MNFLNIWYDMVDSIKSATAVLVITIGFIAIISMIFLSIFKLKNKTIAVLFSTFVSCLFMIPVISSFNHLVDLKMRGAIMDEERAEIMAQREEAERLRAESRIRNLERERLENQITIAKQSIEMESLNDNIKLLENAQLSVQSFERILELALLQTNIQQTLVRKESINEPVSGWGLRAQYYYDEVLVVISHDIDVKFGVNLNDVKISKIDENTVVITGIRPTFIGTSRNITNTILKEIRRVNYRSGVLSSVDIQNDNLARERADRYADTYENEFQQKLSEGIAFSFMDDAVIQLAQNFIKVMLAPLYRNIRFDNADRQDSLPLMAYLQKELKENQDRRTELADDNFGLLLKNEELEYENIMLLHYQEQ